MSSARLAWLAAGVAGTGLVVRVVRSRHRRALHPRGRSFTGALEISGGGDRVGSALLDEPGRYPATVRVSKGAGTRGGRLDVRGLAVRVHLLGRDLDLLLSTAGHGPLSRHVPMPRRTFAATYGTITPYRTGTREKVYLLARPDPGAPRPGSGLDAVDAGDRFLLAYRHAGTERTAGRVTLDRALTPALDAALAFDPVHNSLHDLHPTGLVHGVRAFAYRLSQRWRGAAPVPPNPEAVARTSAHL